MSSTPHDAIGSTATSTVEQRVEYRHHPQFGRVVIEVLAACDDAVQPWVRVVLDDGSRRELPRWMLDASVCDAMPEVVAPRLGLSAMRSLRCLVDGQRALLETSPQTARRRRTAGGNRAHAEPAPARTATCDESDRASPAAEVGEGGVSGAARADHEGGPPRRATPGGWP